MYVSSSSHLIWSVYQYQNKIEQKTEKEIKKEKQKWNRKVEISKNLYFFVFLDFFCSSLSSVFVIDKNIKIMLKKY